MWHVSVGILDIKRGAVNPTEFLSESNRRVAIKAAKQFLGDVGQLPSQLEQMALSFHYRRAMSDAEIALLPAWFCSFVPVHNAGHGILLERNEITVI